MSTCVVTGEGVGLAGESGSGKSTLAHAITRLLRPPALFTRAGSSTTTGRHRRPVDVLTLPKAQLRRYRWEEIAVVFQSAMNALNPVTDVRNQLTDALRAHRPDQPGRQGRAGGELLDLVGVRADRLRASPTSCRAGCASE